VNGNALRITLLAGRSANATAIQGQGAPESLEALRNQGCGLGLADALPVLNGGIEEAGQLGRNRVRITSLNVCLGK